MPSDFADTAFKLNQWPEVNRQPLQLNLVKKDHTLLTDSTFSNKMWWWSREESPVTKITVTESGSYKVDEAS